MRCNVSPVILFLNWTATVNEVYHWIEQLLSYRLKLWYDNRTAMWLYNSPLPTIFRLLCHRGLFFFYWWWKLEDSLMSTNRLVTSDWQILWSHEIVLYASDIKHGIELPTFSGIRRWLHTYIHVLVDAIPVMIWPRPQHLSERDSRKTRYLSSWFIDKGCIDYNFVVSQCFLMRSEQFFLLYQGERNIKIYTSFSKVSQIFPPFSLKSSEREVISPCFHQVWWALVE